MSGLVLIIEDDPDIAEALRYNLERERFLTRTALTGEEGLAASLDPQHPPALILLDLMLPGMSGTDLCRRLRREPLTRRTPIIMVTASTSPADIAKGLALGADAYITKPFSVRELIARVHLTLAHAAPNTTENYEDSRLHINFAEMSTTSDGVILNLTRKEFELLALLASNANSVVTHKQLINDLWGRADNGETHLLDVHIRHLRRQLGACSHAIETVDGIGYRFVGCGAAANHT